MQNKKPIIIALVIIVVLAGGVFAYLKWGRGGQNAARQPTQKELEHEKFVNQMKAIYNVDKDFDGLSDEEEKKLGTSPTSSDTDGDGLLDRDEIQIYKTNPLKADTDGDGKKDGYEVRRGMDPLK